MERVGNDASGDDPALRRATFQRVDCKYRGSDCGEHDEAGASLFRTGRSNDRSEKCMQPVRIKKSLHNPPQSFPGVLCRFARTSVVQDDDRDVSRMANHHAWARYDCNPCLHSGTSCFAFTLLLLYARSPLLCVFLYCVGFFLRFSKDNGIQKCFLCGGRCMEQCCLAKPPVKHLIQRILSLCDWTLWRGWICHGLLLPVG
mmetsp:Transcript_30475/g.68842  ORF Transcript_30475/g.68842 Transcript_30475/m.68842 type:complete len:201 (+) Transcript_30475:294-896(+)